MYSVSMAGPPVKAPMLAGLAHTLGLDAVGLARGVRARATA